MKRNCFVDGKALSLAASVILLLVGVKTTHGAQRMRILDPAIMAAATAVLTRPLIKRVYHADDVPAEFLDTRVAALVTNANNRRRIRLRWRCAIFFRHRRWPNNYRCWRRQNAPARTKNLKAELRARMLAQLDEMTSWHPLNRPGWTLYEPGPPVAADFNDGNWLGHRNRNPRDHPNVAHFKGRRPTGIEGKAR